MTIATSGAEVDELLTWLRAEILKTQYGDVGLRFHMHQGAIVKIERTTSVTGRFKFEAEGEGD